MYAQAAHASVGIDAKPEVRERTIRQEFLLVVVTSVSLKLHARKDVDPPRFRFCQRFKRSVVRSDDSMNRTTLWEVSLEVICVDLDPLDEAFARESNDAIVGRLFAAALRLPAVAHVDRAARHDKVISRTEKHDLRADDARTVLCGR